MKLLYIPVIFLLTLTSGFKCQMSAENLSRESENVKAGIMEIFDQIRSIAVKEVAELPTPLFSRNPTLEQQNAGYYESHSHLDKWPAVDHENLLEFQQQQEKFHTFNKFRQFQRPPLESLDGEDEVKEQFYRKRAPANVNSVYKRDKIDYTGAGNEPARPYSGFNVNRFNLNKFETSSSNLTPQRSLTPPSRTRIPRENPGKKPTTIETTETDLEGASSDIYYYYPYPYPYYYPYYYSYDPYHYYYDYHYY